MKKLEKYKIMPQAKFVKFKMKHFVEIPTSRHDKAVPSPWLTASNHLPPWMCPHPGPWSLAVAPLPGWWHKNHSPHWPEGGGHYVDCTEKLNWGGIDFQASALDYKKLEKLNEDIALNLFFMNVSMNCRTRIHF